MSADLDGARWRLRIVHNCDNRVLRGAAIRRMIELKKDARTPVAVEHQHHEKAGVDEVNVVWMSQRITVVVAFNPGQALVGIKVPLVLQIFRSAVENRVHREIRHVVEEAGGNVSDIVQVQ